MPIFDSGTSNGRDGNEGEDGGELSAGRSDATFAKVISPLSVVRLWRAEVCCGVVFGRPPGQRVKADRFAPKVLKLVGEGQSYREISHRLGPSKNTVLQIVKRDRAA
jgi:hypothetical protein